MEFIHLATGHFDLLSVIASIALIFNGLEVWHLNRSQRIANLLTINNQHRETWTVYLTNPQVARVLDPKADITKQPVTAAEETFVLMLVLILNASYQASKAGMFRPSFHLPQDIKTFFAFPIPWAIWCRSRQFQDADFIRYVEQALG